ncbi:hypothetical protein Ancab_003733 [Ancistrocladus abbreviatus]
MYVAIKAAVLPTAKCSIVLRSDYCLRWNTPMYFIVKKAPDMHFLVNQDSSSGCQANDGGHKPVRGWDQTLHEIGKLLFETIISPLDAASLWKVMEHLPVLVVAGAEYALVSVNSSEAIASKLMNYRVVATSGCGHLPHEVCPKALLGAMPPELLKLASLNKSPAEPSAGANAPDILFGGKIEISNVKGSKIVTELGSLQSIHSTRISTALTE